MAYVMQRTPGVPRFQRAQHQDINDFAAKAGEFGDQIATQNIMRTLNAAKQADENITARGMMDMLQKQGIRQEIADKGNEAITQMFAPTAAEATTAANEAELIKMNREFNRDKEMQDIKAQDSLQLAGINNASRKAIADARNTVYAAAHEGKNTTKHFIPGTGLDFSKIQSSSEDKYDEWDNDIDSQLNSQAAVLDMVKNSGLNLKDDAVQKLVNLSTVPSIFGSWAGNEFDSEAFQRGLDTLKANAPIYATPEQIAAAKKLAEKNK